MVNRNLDELWERPDDYMKGALTLARLAVGSTSPNPAVGSIIVKHGLVVGMGHTQPPGSWHAEVMALQQAGPRAYGGTMYVTLEPCCHYGKTPPCSDAIINAGIEEVHIATADPNPVVAGKGIAALERAGIRVVLGEMEKDALEVNEAYLKFITTGLPFVTAKLAMSIDGKIATRTGDSKWISGEESRKWVHNLRHTVDAIAVGAGTVKMDDPHLTARLGSGKGGKLKKQPLRVIVDGRGSTPATAQLFKEPGSTLMVLSKSTDQEKRAAYLELGAEVLEMPTPTAGNHVDLKALLAELGRRQLTHVLVEGGSRLIGSMLDADLIDKFILFIAPIIVGGHDAPTAVGGIGVEKISDALAFERMSVGRFGNDIMISGYPKRPIRVQESH